MVSAATPPGQGGGLTLLTKVGLTVVLFSLMVFHWNYGINNIVDPIYLMSPPNAAPEGAPLGTVTVQFCQS